MRLFKNIVAGTILFTSGVIAAMLVVEVMFRLLGVTYPGPFLQPDYDTGWSHRSKTTFPNPIDGERNTITFNSYGMRDHREYELAKPSGTFRVAVLGDSFTEALQVPEEKDFCSIAQRSLSESNLLGVRKVEVLNFGVLGYGTGQELITLRRRIWRWAPDVIVLAFFTNDLADNTRATDAWEQPRGWSWGPRPFFTYQDGHLAEDDSFRESSRFTDRMRANRLSANEWGRGTLFPRHAWLYRILLDLRVRQVLYHLRSAPLVPPLFHLERWLERTLLFGDPDTPARGKADRLTPRPDKLFETEASLLGPPQDPMWRDAWSVTEGTIDEIHREVEAHGATFLLVVVSDPLQVYPNSNFRQGMLSDLFYMNHRIEQLGQHSGFEVLSLAEPFQRYADEHHIFLHDFEGGIPGWGHWNETGHKLAGEMIAAKICEMEGLQRSQAAGCSRWLSVQER
jgi:hypothetical protein